MQTREERKKANEPEGVAAILMRRAALQDDSGSDAGTFMICFNRGLMFCVFTSVQMAETKMNGIKVQLDYFVLFPIPRGDLIAVFRASMACCRYSILSMSLTLSWSSLADSTKR